MLLGIQMWVVQLIDACTIKSQEAEGAGTCVLCVHAWLRGCLHGFGFYFLCMVFGRKLACMLAFGFIYLYLARNSL